MARRPFCSKFLRPLQIGLVVTALLLIDTSYARIGYFWHITDLHLDTIYSTQGDVLRSCWRMDRQSSSSPARSPGRFGDYLCDSPWSLIESAAKAMKSRQGDNVEFVLWTGDGLSHSSHPMFESKKMEILRNITDLLGRTFPSQFVFPVLGHEDGTTTNFRHMGELWRHWLPSEALHTFEKGGYYSIEQTKSRLRIIALNTNFMRHDPKYSQSHLAPLRQRTPATSPDGQEYKNYYYHHGTLHQHHGHAGDWSAFGYGYNGHHRGVPGIGISTTSDGSNNGGRVSALSEYENQDTEKQWIWLEDVLSKSKSNKETVYIVGHIPPGSDERHIGLQQNGHTTFTESNNKRYLDLVRKYSSIIQGQFFGHLHSDSFRIIYDDKGKPVSWMMISPSVTPRKMSVGSNNPAMRLYKFDTDSGQVLDYTQYFMDLQMANTLGEPNWVPEYNLTHYYALSDISAISLHNFVDRFTGSDGSWFSKYYRANAVRYGTDPCEGVCMLNHYCAITRVDYKEFRQCLEKEQSALRSNASIIRGPAMPCFLFLIVLIFKNLHTLSALLCTWISYICEVASAAESAASSTAAATGGAQKKRNITGNHYEIPTELSAMMTAAMFWMRKMRISKILVEKPSLKIQPKIAKQMSESDDDAGICNKDLSIVPASSPPHSLNPNEFAAMTAAVETDTDHALSSAVVVPVPLPMPMSMPRRAAAGITNGIKANTDADADAVISAVAPLLNDGGGKGEGDGEGDGAGAGAGAGVDGSAHVALYYYRPFLLASSNAAHKQHCLCHAQRQSDFSFSSRLIRSHIVRCTPRCAMKQLTTFTWYTNVY